MTDRDMAFVIPLFLLISAAELFLLHRRSPSQLRLYDAVTNFGCGLGNLVLGPLFNTFAVVLYTGIYERFALVRLPTDAAWVWILAIVLVDFVAYWNHRAAHRINALWACHVVHHQSEHFNVTIALRQTWVSKPIDALFFACVAFVGIHPSLFMTAFAVVAIYQFWIHTELIGSLGPLEWVLNTPMHHRAHHGVNPQYIDRNYGAIFILWDRLFGTFEPFGEKPVYGTIRPLRSLNPVYANVVQWREVIRNVHRARSMRDRAMALFGPPEWQLGEDGGPLAKNQAVENYRRYPTIAPPPPRGSRARYVLLNLALATLGAMAYARFYVETPVPVLVLGALALVATMTVVAGVLQGRKWSQRVDVGRWLALAGAVVLLLFSGSIPLR